MGNEAKDERDRRIKVNLATAEGKIFVAIVKRARGDARALSSVAYAHDRLGLPISWMRERMAGRIRVKPLDLIIVEQLIAIAKSSEPGATPRDTHPKDRAEVAEYRRSVAKFCRGCAPEREDGSEQLCPDSECALRSVSPLQLDPRGYGAMIVGKDWSR